MRFEDLDVWKRSARLSAEIYKVLAALRDFGFRDQITRSGLSIPSNIAEGIERESDREVARFLTIAKGSCGELRTQIYIGMEIGYIPPSTGVIWVQESKEISAMLMGLIRRRREMAEQGQVLGSRKQVSGGRVQEPRAKYRSPAPCAPEPIIDSEPEFPPPAPCPLSPKNSETP